MNVVGRDRGSPLIVVRTVPKSGDPVDVSEQIFSLTYEDDEKKADKLTLSIDNYDLRNFDNPVFAKGVLLEASWGYPGNMSPRRQVVIQSVKGAQILTVEALDKGILANKIQKSRTFERVTRSDIVKTIAKEQGYDARHIETTTIVFDHIVQASMTDSQFIKYLADKEGFEYFVDFDGLHWHPKNLTQAPANELVWFADGTGTLMEFNVENDITAVPAVVTQSGRDPMKKENFTVSADDKSTPRTGSPILETIDPRTGNTYDTVPKGTATVAPATESSPAAAKKVVDGQFKRAQITLVQLKGCKMIGDPNFLAKTMVKIAGLRSCSGNYYVTRAKHTVGAGFIIDFDCQRDGKDHAIPATKPQASKASPNNQDPKDPSLLEPIDKIDKRTAQTVTTFQDTRGRSSGVKPAS